MSLALYTSRWANKDISRLDCVPVGISRGNPRFQTGFRYRRFFDLAPSRETMSLDDAGAFERAYREGLDALGAERIVSGLSRISDEHGGLPLVLLCYENLDRDGFCHRRFAASWIQDHTSLVVPELEPGMIPAKPGEPEQPALL